MVPSARPLPDRPLLLPLLASCTLISDAEITAKVGTSDPAPVVDADTDVDVDTDTDTAHDTDTDTGNETGLPDTGADSGDDTGPPDTSDTAPPETGDTSWETGLPDTGDPFDTADTGDTSIPIDTGPIISDGVADWTAEGTLPEPRAYATAVFDDVDSTVLVYGGMSYYQLPETLLSYDFGAAAWSSVATTGTSPGGGIGHSAIVDAPTERMLVMFGEGYHTLSDEVFTFDLASLDWDTLTSTGTGPEARTGAAVVVDEDGSRAIVVGGMGYNGLLDDVWELDLTVTGSASWNELTPGGTLSPRAFASAAFDPQYRSLYLFGGAEYHGLAEEIACLDLDALTWSSPTVTGDSPTPAEDMSATWAEEYEGVLVQGGAAYHGMLDATWLLVGTDVCTLEGLELVNSGDSPDVARGAALAWIPGDAMALSVGGQGMHTLSSAARSVAP